MKLELNDWNFDLFRLACPAAPLLSEFVWLPTNREITANARSSTSLEMDWTLNLPESLLGGMKNPHIFSKTQFIWKYFPKHVQIEDMAHFDICYAILENIVDLTSCSILSLSQGIRIPQNTKVQDSKNTVR